MKKILLLFLSLLALASCRYDDSAIWDQLNDHESRITELEVACEWMNENIISLQTIVSALEAKDYVTSVTPVYEGDKEVGYKINFSRSGSITIYHGINGQTPVIGVRMHSDGVYYWTLNGEWILDNDGNKIHVAGVDGNDGAEGVTPKLKIDDGDWFISYDNGSTWSRVGQAVGDPGDSFFQNVIVGDDAVEIILKDGQTFTIPVYRQVSITFDIPDNETVIAPSETIAIEYVLHNADEKTIVSASSDGNYKVKVVSEGTEGGKIYITSPSAYVDGFINVLLSDGNGYTSLYVISIDKKNMSLYSGREYSIGADGGELSIPLSTNFRYYVEMTPTDRSWITVLDTKAEEWEGEILLQVAQNTSQYSRTGRINVYAENNPDKAYCVIVIKQSENAPQAGTMSDVHGDVPSSYNGFNVVCSGGEAEVVNGRFQLESYENDHVQTFVLADDDDKVYMISRTSLAGSDNVELNAYTTSVAMVTMHPLFAPVAAADYDAVVSMVTSCSTFPQLQNEVQNTISDRRDIFDENNDNLLIALSNLMEEISGNVNEGIDDDEFSGSLDDILTSYAAATKAIYENPEVYPFYADISGNVLTLRNIGLTPSYYGTVVGPDGRESSFSVPARSDYGGMDLFKENVDEFMLGDPRTYSFTSDGKYSFYLSRMNTAATADFYLRLANSILTSLGLELEQEVMVEISNSIARAMINMGSGVNDVISDPMDWVGIAYDAVVEWMQQDYWEAVNKGNIIRLGKILSGSLNAYGKIKGTFNASLRLAHSLSAPEEVNFSVCWFDGTVTTCSNAVLYKLDGDEQQGYAGQKLFTPISVYVESMDGDSRYRNYNVKFEVVSGGGKVESELVAADNDYIASTYWKLGDAGEQKVKVTAIDIITGREISQPVYFTAELVTAQVTVRLDWNKHSGKTDIDLHVVDPYGEKIYYSHMNSASGGYLDRDDRVGPGPEHIRWTNAPAGTYKIYVHYYPNNDPDRSITSYKVSVTAGGVAYQPKSGSIAYDQMIAVGQFTIGENGTPVTFSLPELSVTEVPADFSLPEKDVLRVN